MVKEDTKHLCGTVWESGGPRRIRRMTNDPTWSDPLRRAVRTLAPHLSKLRVCMYRTVQHSIVQYGTADPSLPRTRSHVPRLVPLPVHCGIELRSSTSTYDVLNVRCIDGNRHNKSSTVLDVSVTDWTRTSNRSFWS